MNAEENPIPRAASLLQKLTVRAWFLLALSVIGILTLLAAGAGTIMLSRTTQAADRLVEDVAPARAEALRLQAALLDQETGIRGYLLTGDKTLLEPYHRGLEAQSQSRTRLKNLTGDIPAAAADLEAVDQAVRNWRDSYATPALTAAEPRKPGSVEAGSAAFDRVRQHLSTQQKHLDRAQDQARSTFTQARDERDHVLLGALAAFLLAGVGLAFLLHYTVVRPLAAVRVAARRVAEGAFDHHIPHQGPADLQALSGAVEAMRQRVVSELDASRQNEAALAAQAAELDTQAVELRRSNAELEQFAYVASHDLQEPLRKVASFCQLLEKRYGDRLDDRGAQYIAFAVDGAKRMQILINDLLTFSRVGRLNDARETVALDTVVDRAVRNLAAAMEESGARIERPEELPQVTGDPTLLTMLWQNLVGNAIKFRHPERAPHIELTVDRDEENDHWRFTVTDNGIGIPAEFAEKVFVIFQRLHGRDAYEGTGIGLSLCKKIIEHSGGRIWIDTTHSDGTRLAFTLPAITSSEVEISATSSEGSAA